MAKKKTEEKEPTNFREQLRASIIKKYGDGTSKEMTELSNEEKVIIPVSPAMDRALNGGIPEGSWVILSGPEKVGKTTLALQIAANAQKLGKIVYFLDIEGRFKKMNINTVASFQPDMCEHIRSQYGKILSAEEYLEIGMEIAKTHPGCVLIIDSASALCASKELTGEITANTRNDGPKLLASFCRQMANVVPINNITMIIIQHMIANTSGMGHGPTKMEDGGNKIKYQVDVKLRAKYSEKWNDNENNQIGQLAHWDVVCSALGPPGAKVQNYIRYNYGIDDIMELIQLATDFGVINKAGAWYSFSFNDEEKKAQGMEKMHQLLFENPELFEFIKKEVNSI